MVRFGTELAIDSIDALPLPWPNSGDYEFYLGPTTGEEGEAKQKTGNLVHLCPAHSQFSRGILLHGLKCDSELGRAILCCFRR